MTGYTEHSLSSSNSGFKSDSILHGSAEIFAVENEHFHEATLFIFPLDSHMALRLTDFHTSAIT